MPSSLVGEVQALYIATHRGGPITPMPSVFAMAHRGIAMDRHYLGRDHGAQGTADITLIETEVLLDLGLNTPFALFHGEHRRNVVTVGIRLNDLLGQRFSIGNAICYGESLCHPCAHLAHVTGKGHELVSALARRGGLRASIESSGSIVVGAPIKEI